MRERGEAEAGGVRVLLQSVAPSQSGSETLSWRGYGEDGCCVTLNTPTWTLSESLLYYTLFRRVHSDSTVLLSFVFFGTIGHCQSGILNRVHTCTYTHITQHLLYLLLRPKTLVPPPFRTLFMHTYTLKHIHNHAQKEMQLPHRCIFQGGSVNCWSHQQGLKPKHAERLVKDCTKNRFGRNR